MNPFQSCKIIVATAACSLTLGAVAANFPFPQHVNYAAGILPSNVSQASLDNTTSNYWNAYKSRYIKSAGGTPTRYYIAYNLEGQGDTGASTVSEAHGYGMVLTAYMGDKTHFDGMYWFYKDHPSQNNSWLMAWQQDTSFNDMNGADSATDGDMDIAYSLLIADKQWGSAGTINYLHEATNMINAIMQSDVNQTQWTLRLGDWATTGSSQGYNYSTSTRPSDFMIDHLRSYYEATGDSRWNNVINQIYSIVNTIFNANSPNTGLIPDFVVYNGTTYLPAPANFLEGSTDGKYAYNSCRTPWRFATDYLLTGSSSILTEMRKMNSWIQSSSGGNVDHIYPGYSLGGTALDTSYTDDSFTTPFGLCSLIDSGNQTWANTMWTWIAARGINVNDGYFGNSITMQSVIVISGNWWKPSYSTIDTSAIYQLQNEASGLVLNNQGSLTNGSKITQWSSVSSDNLRWHFSNSRTSSGYYEIVSQKSGLDAVVQSASTSQGAGIIQWSFGSSGDDQWRPVLNSDGSYTFYNLHSGLVLEDPGSSTSNTTQMDQWGANGGANQKWKLILQ